MSDVFDAVEHAAFSKWYLSNLKEINAGTEQAGGGRQAGGKQQDGRGQQGGGEQQEGEDDPAAQPEVGARVVSKDQQNGE